jgi:HSP20 family molecular chaperone IbpA
MRQPQRSRLAPIFLPAAASCGDICWRPAVDIYRSRYGWLVKFDLAGVRLEDIRLEIQGRRLSVSGTRRDWMIEQGYY